jgi:sigma-54 specific flagellar transcriptional regulator A
VSEEYGGSPRLEAFAEALSGTLEEFVGDSDVLREVQVQLSEVAPTDLTVLILEDTGTGKGLAARTLHGLSARKGGAFVPVNCGAIPEHLVESELFGHERGAFTGAVRRKLGKVEVAEGGTLFLHEIGDLSLDAQVKLLRLLEERTFERVGGAQTLSADVRVIAATNHDLEQMVGRAPSGRICISDCRCSLCVCPRCGSVGRTFRIWRCIS